MPRSAEQNLTIEVNMAIEALTFDAESRTSAVRRLKRLRTVLAELLTKIEAALGG